MTTQGQMQPVTVITEKEGLRAWWADGSEHFTQPGLHIWSDTPTPGYIGYIPQSELQAILTRTTP